MFWDMLWCILHFLIQTRAFRESHRSIKMYHVVSNRTIYNKIKTNQIKRVQVVLLLVPSVNCVLVWEEPEVSYNASADHFLIVMGGVRCTPRRGLETTEVLLRRLTGESTATTQDCLQRGAGVCVKGGICTWHPQRNAMSRVPGILRGRHTVTFCILSVFINIKL